MVFFDSTHFQNVPEFMTGFNVRVNHDVSSTKGAATKIAHLRQKWLVRRGADRDAKYKRGTQMCKI